MKRVLVLILCSTLLILMGVACAGTAGNDPADNGKGSESFFFTGVVMEINGQTIIVEPNDGEAIRGSGDKVAITLEENEMTFAVGDSVVVEYDGNVMESYPLQINLISIEKSSD